MMVQRIVTVFLFSILIVGFAFATTEKGDTLVIHQADQDALPWNEIITADTVAGGAYAHAVYELDVNGWYPMSTTLTTPQNSDLVIVGGKRTSASDWRPVILVSQVFDWSWWMIGANGNVTLKGLHWEQCEESTDGRIGQWARAGVGLWVDDKKVVIHDCIWDFNTGFAALLNKNGLNLSVTNTLFRFNKAADNGVWAGQGLDVSSANIDTVILKNCTWYGGGPFMFKTWGSTEKYIEIDHCTFADFVQWPFHGVHWVNSKITNNLFYNAYTMGEDSTQIKGQDPDGLGFGIVNIDTIFADTTGMVITPITTADTSYIDTSYTTVTNWTREAGRNLFVSNNNNFTKQNIKDYWAVCLADPATYHDFKVSDPAFYDGFMNSRSQAMFADDAKWPGLELANTTSLDPGFADYFDYSDTLIAYSKSFYGYAWGNPAGTTFMSDPDEDILDPTDAMFYNLKVTNAALRTASTTGGPVGDLTWELADGYNTANIPMVVGVDNKVSAKAESFALEQNYPNPFNPTTNINFTIKNASQVELAVYNLMGQKVATLVNGKLTAGTHTATWDASAMSSGVYFYTLKADNQTKTYKMMLMK